jgi:ParB-like chromosome segregation protein Spo0J
MKTLKVDKEFRDLCRPLTKDELADLTAAITRDGCRDSIVIWKDKIIDGHHRYKICNKLGIGYRVTVMTFPSRDHAKVWIIDNQAGKRNATEADIHYLRGVKYALLESMTGAHLPKGDSLMRTTVRIRENKAKTAKVSEKQALAKKENVGRRQLEKDAVFAGSLDKVPAIRDRVRSGELKASAPDVKRLVELDPKQIRAITAKAKTAKNLKDILPPKLPKPSKNGAPTSVSRAEAELAKGEKLIVTMKGITSNLLNALDVPVSREIDFVNGITREWRDRLKAHINDAKAAAKAAAK